MLLEKKNGVIYGAGGAIGGALAHAFAREGASVFLTGRQLASVEGSSQGDQSQRRKSRGCSSRCLR